MPEKVALLWHDANRPMVTDAIVPDLAPTDNDGWVALANANIDAGGPGPAECLPSTMADETHGS